MEAKPELRDLKQLAIYVTGSYGRLEAASVSDLDLFFIEAPGHQRDIISRIDKVLMDAAVIQESRKLGFPEFSGDGVYLEVHNLDQVLLNLGSPADDHENYFTARLLLLLESRPVLNDHVYEAAVREIVRRYFRDYHDHVKDFLPVFLANDIIRFWKTLCLNYEHSRNRQGNDATEKAKAHLKNLKLKFSRLLTCFSGIVALCGNGGHLSEDDVVRVVHLSPVDRLIEMSISNDAARPIVEEMLQLYTWFLEITGEPKPQVLSWISDEANRDQAFAKGARFGKLMHDLVMEAARPNGLTRYLLV